MYSLYVKQKINNNMKPDHLLYETICKAHKSLIFQKRVFTLLLGLVVFYLIAISIDLDTSLRMTQFFLIAFSVMIVLVISHLYRLERSRQTSIQGAIRIEQEIISLYQELENRLRENIEPLSEEFHAQGSWYDKQIKYYRSQIEIYTAKRDAYQRLLDQKW